MLFNKGEHIGQYTVSFPHKQSNYAETYRVKDTKGKTLFLKLIKYSKLNRNQIDDNGRVVELQIVKQLHHHNICKCIDTGSLMINGGQCAYIVTEFVSGETLLEKIIREEELDVYTIKQIVKSILSALQYLHSQIIPIIHGEITMQNVLLNLVGGYSDLKLIDFGHACYINQKPIKPDLTELNAFYLAPERFSGVSQVQSDLYSVGVLMYRLLYGELPWFKDVSRLPVEQRVDAILAERQKVLRNPSVDIFELDEQLINCVAKSLCYDVEDRFQTAEEFIKAIDGEIKVESPSSRKKSASVQGNILIPQPTVKKGEGFAAVAGMEELKKKLREDIIEPLHNPDIYRQYGITIPNGMLLYGPPGCGKTFFAKHLAEEVNFNFLCITPATLKSQYVNATQENIAKMFKKAEANAPTIIFIDELNELVPCRDSRDIHEMSRSAVNEMLAQMDRTSEKGIFIIGATNYPNMIDPAILRAGRLDRKYYIGVPDQAARKALFELYLKNRPYDFGLDYNELASLTKNYVSADIHLIVNDASRKALKLHSKITMSLLKETIMSTKPSLKHEELAKYEKIKAQMEGNETDNRPTIGFIK